jgi:hypothetical protein
MMPANVQATLSDVEAGNVPRAMLRIGILVVGAIVGLLISPSSSKAGEQDPCPIPGCVDDGFRTCGICQTINGSYAVYYP